MKKCTYRVLQVLGILDRGGAETMIMNLYRAINRDQIQFDFVVHTEQQGAYDEEVIGLGGKIFHAPKYIVKNHVTYKKWWETFFEEHPEYSVIHYHLRNTAAIVLPIAKKRACIL
ncbi:MAG: hypothetical protein LIO96_03330 [Lachnospiraceae bacterium]|nr:hypothetical protein [Lachnospiraceae bacterium]